MAKLDDAQKNEYLEQQAQLGINFDNNVQAVTGTIMGIPDAVGQFVNDTGAAIGDAATNAANAVGDAMSAAGDSILGNMYASSMMDYAQAEASALPMATLWANMGAQQDVIANMTTGGEFALEGHSYYLDRMENVATIEENIATAYEQAGIASTEGLSGLNKHFDEAQEESQGSSAEDSASNQPVADTAAQDAPDAGNDLVAGMQNFFRGGLIAGTIPNIDTSKLDAQFKDMGDGIGAGVKEVNDVIREAVNTATLDTTSASPNKDLQAGA